MAKRESTKSKKRKNFKKDVINKIEKQESSAGRELLKVLRIVFVVLVFLAAFYLLTVVIVDYDSDDNESTEASIQYEEILAGSSFIMRDSEYLVLYYDFSDEELTELSSAIYSYSYSSDSLRVYTVDMSNRFNSNYVTKDESNKRPESAKDLAINGATLIKINDGNVEEYIEGIDLIIDYLS